MKTEECSSSALCNKINIYKKENRSGSGTKSKTNIFWFLEI